MLRAVLSSAAEPVVLLVRASVGHDLCFPNPWWLSPVIFLPFTCLVMVSRRICFMDTEVRLTGLAFPSSSLPLVKINSGSFRLDKTSKIFKSYR